MLSVLLIGLCIVYLFVGGCCCACLCVCLRVCGCVDMSVGCVCVCVQKLCAA